MDGCFLGKSKAGEKLGLFSICPFIRTEVQDSIGRECNGLDIRSAQCDPQGDVAEVILYLRADAHFNAPSSQQFKCEFMITLFNIILLRADSKIGCFLSGWDDEVIAANSG